MQWVRIDNSLEFKILLLEGDTTKAVTLKPHTPLEVPLALDEEITVVMRVVAIEREERE